jgi:hypothetical protein
MNEMRWLTLLTVICIVLVGFLGCDRVKCMPDGRLEKTGEIYGGIKCGGNW